MSSQICEGNPRNLQLPSIPYLLCKMRSLSLWSKPPKAAPHPSQSCEPVMQKLAEWNCWTGRSQTHLLSPLGGIALAR